MVGRWYTVCRRYRQRSAPRCYTGSIMRTRSFLATFLTSLAASAAAGAFAIGGDFAIGSWVSPYGLPPPAIVYDAFGRCLMPQNCPDYEQMRRFLDRYERNHGQLFAPLRGQVVEPPAQRRDVAPTPEAHIQPAYRAASQIRPEYEKAGTRLDVSPQVGR